MQPVVIAAEQAAAADAARVSLSEDGSRRGTARAADAGVKAGLT